MVVSAEAGGDCPASICSLPNKAPALPMAASGGWGLLGLTLAPCTHRPRTDAHLCIHMRACVRALAPLRYIVRCLPYLAGLQTIFRPSAEPFSPVALEGLARR